MAKMGKKSKQDTSMEVDSSDEAPKVKLSPIAHPLAEKKLAKRLLKTIKKASKAKAVRRGVKEVVKALRKGEKGMVVLAGDVSPIDVISHIPVLCEDSSIPYCYVNSRAELGEAGLSKRPTSVMMVIPQKDSDFAESYDECLPQIQTLNATLSVPALC